MLRPRVSCRSVEFGAEGFGLSSEEGARPGAGAAGGGGVLVPAVQVGGAPTRLVPFRRAFHFSFLKAKCCQLGAQRRRKSHLLQGARRPDAKYGRFRKAVGQAAACGCTLAGWGPSSPGHRRLPSPTPMRCVGSCGVSSRGFLSFTALGTSTHELGLLVASTQLPPDGAGVRRPSKPPWGAPAVPCPGNVLSRCHHGMRGVCELGRAGIPARSGPSPRAAEAEGPGAPRERRAPSPAFLAAAG